MPLRRFLALAVAVSASALATPTRAEPSANEAAPPSTADTRVGERLVPRASAPREGSSSSKVPSPAGGGTGNVRTVRAGKITFWVSYGLAVFIALAPRTAPVMGRLMGGEGKVHFATEK